MASGGIRTNLLSIPDRPRGKVLEVAEPLIESFVTELYGGQKARRCPGEDHCEDFISTRGKTREEKEKAMCIGQQCPLFPTKPKRSNGDVDQENGSQLLKLIDSAFEIRQRRVSGYPVEAWRMTNLEFAALVKLDAMFERFENYLKKETLHTYKMVQAFLSPKK